MVTGGTRSGVMFRVSGVNFSNLCFFWFTSFWLVFDCLMGVWFSWASERRVISGFYFFWVTVLNYFWGLYGGCWCLFECFGGYSGLGF